MCVWCVHTKIWSIWYVLNENLHKAMMILLVQLIQKRCISETPNLFWEGNDIGLKHRLENKSKLLLLLQLIKKRKRCKIYNWSNCCTKGPPKALPKQDWLWKLLWVSERSHKKKYIYIYRDYRRLTKLKPQIHPKSSISQITKYY